MIQSSALFIFFRLKTIFSTVSNPVNDIMFQTCQCFQENIRRCVCIIYDPSRSDQGVLALKALKLSDSFMELYRSNNFTGEKYEFFLGVLLSIS